MGEADLHCKSKNMIQVKGGFIQPYNKTTRDKL